MLQHKIRRSGDVTIVDLEGRMSLTDTLWAGRGTVLAEVIRELVNSGERKILLNLTGVTYVDSSGIRNLTAAMASVERQNGQLKLLNPTPKVTCCGSLARTLSLDKGRQELGASVLLVKYTAIILRGVTPFNPALHGFQ